jgi:hypothetical protein
LEKPRCWTLVQQLPQVLDESIHRGRLLDEGSGTEFTSSIREATLVEAGVHDDARPGCHLADARQSLQPVHLGHRDVEQQEGRLMPLGKRHGLASVGAFSHDREALRQAQLGSHEEAYLRRVVHDDHRRYAIRHGWKLPD